MKLNLSSIAAAALICLCAGRTFAADYPAPKQGDWVAKDFRFHSGEVMSEMKLHYTTVGDPAGEPVLIIHGTTGSGSGMLAPAFAAELFGPGQALDAKKYFIILPDSIGAGGSAKPSDGMHAKFPAYNYDDMVLAQYRLVTEGLGLKHLRMVMGNSMGGMHVWVWGVNYPDFMDALVPMASQPAAMSSRNWMMRRMVIDSVRNDPAWQNGEYKTQPPMLRVANAFFGIATNGGSIAYQKQAPTREQADKLLSDRLNAPFTIDANDYMYRYDASRDYDPSSKLGTIKASVLAINSADDERNPPETGVMDEAMKQIKGGKLLLIPASADTRGHDTTSMAKFYAKQLQEFLQNAPKRAM